MDSFGGLGAASEVAVDLITDAYRITGVTQTRFSRVTDIVNQLLGQHLSVEQGNDQRARRSGSRRWPHPRRSST